MLTLGAQDRKRQPEAEEGEQRKGIATHESSMHRQCLVTLPSGSQRSVAKLMLSAQLKPRLKPEW